MQSSPPLLIQSEDNELSPSFVLKPVETLRRTTWYIEMLHKKFEGRILLGEPVRGAWRRAGSCSSLSLFGSPKRERRNKAA